MKKNVVVLIGLVILFSMSFIFAEINIETIIEDVEISDGDFTFDSNTFEDEWSVDYNVESITIKPIFIEAIDFSEIEVLINTESVLNPVLENTTWVYDEVLVPLAVGTNMIDIQVTETIDGVDSIVTYKYEVIRNNILKDLDIYVDDVRLELEPKFDTLMTVYDNLIDMPEKIVFDYELDNFILEKNYRMVITDVNGDTIVENENLELLDFNDYVKDVFYYGKNTITFTIETEEDVVDGDVTTKEWVLLESYDFSFIVNPLKDVVVYTVNEDLLSNKTRLLELTPTFDNKIFSYVGLVDIDVDTIEIMASLLDDVTINDTLEIKINNVIYSAMDLRKISFPNENLAISLKVTKDEEVFLYTIDLYKKGYLEKLDFYFANENNSLVKLDMAPLFNQTNQPYEVIIPPTINEIVLLTDFSNDETDKSVFINGIAYEAFHKVAVSYGESIVLVEVKKDNVVIESYEITISRSKNLSGLELAPIGDFGFDPEDYSYNIDVSKEIDVVTVKPTIGVNEKVYIDGVLLNTLTQDVALEYGKNTIEVTVVFNDVALIYTVVIDRDSPVDSNKPHNSYRFHYSNLDIEKDDDDYEFGSNSYSKIVESFKWGNNKTNEIVIEVSDDEGEINIPYPIYKFMTQRKVSFIIEFDGEEYAIDLSEMKLNRYIKGSQNVQLIQIEFEIDDDNIDVETDIKFTSNSNDNYKDDDHDDDEDDDHDDEDDDDDDDEDDDDDDNHNNSKNKSNGHKN